MLDRQETGDLFGLYLENKELTIEEFLKLMKDKKETKWKEKNLYCCEMEVTE